MKPLKEHGYVLIIDDTKVNGHPVSTQIIRQYLGSSLYTEDKKKKFFRLIFGWFDIGLYTLVSSKFKQGYQVSSNEKSPEEEAPAVQRNPPTTIPQSRVPSSAFRENITKLVHEILKEIMDEDYSSTMTSTTGGDSMASALDVQKNPSQQRADAAKQKLALNKEKQLATKELDTMKKDVKWKEADLRTKRTMTLKQQQDKIDALNKQISNPDTTTTTDVSAATSDPMASYS
jgi:hypothetical protein